ncbi:oligosaccharide repeat unit polymerase [Chitinophaga deserti]|uniref:oligosaccharide repeat unit polymerase n=1 Tax=Chitinophaga deserti TaxID=2164099 RepID=UPI000D6D0736|nr:oligosaccharide repeat unit polymerase [Chitinophaga deserti]
MKKAYISILIFFLVAHFVIPGLYYLYDGFFSIYEAGFNDYEAIKKTYLLNGISLLATSLIVWMLPSKVKQIKPNIKNLTPFFYFSIGLGIVSYVTRGGYEGAISGSTAGSLLNYIMIFINPIVILKVLLFFQEKKYNVGLLFLVTIAYITFTGSRSAIISLFLVILIFPAFSNYEHYKKQIWRYMAIFMVAAPFLFVLASQVRGMEISLLGDDLIIKAIFGRLSMVELSAIPIHYKDSGDFNMDMFFDKYGIWHQIKLMIDSIFPGNIFTPDVMPNQYYRAIFLGYSEEFVQEIYMSINTTLPVYFYMYTGMTGAIILTVGVLTAYFLVWRKYANNILISVSLITQLYTLLYCFDFVMWFSQVLTTILSLLSIYLYTFSRKKLANYLKKNESAVV